MVKKKKSPKKGKKSYLLILLIAFLVFAFLEIDFPDELLHDIIPKQEETTKQEASKKGDNPGPIEHGPATFTDYELKNSTKGWIEYGLRDKQGRPTEANALIKPDMINTGTSANQSIRPPGFISGKAPNNHSRGHLIGKQLGGTGDKMENLVTLYQNPVNTPFMTKYENMVRKAADNGETIRYRVTPVYKEDEPMPIAVDMEAKGLDKNSTIDFYVTIENKK